MAKVLRKLVKVHTHMGVQLPAGAIIECDEPTAKWLDEQHVSVPVFGAEAAKQVTKPQQQQAAARRRSCCGGGW